MKKLTAIILALLLTLGCAALAEEASMPAGAAAYEGVWQCDRATAALYWEEEGYKVLITWGSSAWEETEWEYSCYYNEEDHTLSAVPFGTRREVVYGEDGEPVSATEAYNDGEAVFSLDADGCLLWQDLKENAGEGMRFEKLPEEPAALTFATVGDAMASEGYTGIAGGDEDHHILVVEQDGAYLRLVADLDDEARRLFDATMTYEDIDELEDKFAAYNAYLATLPVTYEEEITAQPLPQEELDALAGKTIPETEAAGFYHVTTGAGENGEAVYTVSCGLYNYDLTLDATYDEYTELDDDGYYGDLTVKSAAFSGISSNAADLRWHADGAYDAEEDAFAVFNGLMAQIEEALSSDNPEEAIRALTEAMPEQAEEIRIFAELFTQYAQQGD